MSKTYIFLLAIIVMAISCTATRKIPSTSDSDEQGPHITLDTMTIMPETDVMVLGSNATYNPAEDRTWDLLHTLLDISFDWSKSSVSGTATLTLSPLFYDQTTLELDAVDFNIKKLLVNGKPTTNFPNQNNFPMSVCWTPKPAITS